MKFFSPKWLLHLEGLVVLSAATVAYRATGASWGEFALLFLAPDLFMLGYCFGSRVGAAVYNVGHTYTAPAMLGLILYSYHQGQAAPLALIWTAHIGFDRLLGYGLKYPSGFKKTHLTTI